MSEFREALNLTHINDALKMEFWDLSFSQHMEIFSAMLNQLIENPSLT